MPVSDNYLLVPMQLDVMVLNQQSSAATPFLRFEMDYTKLASFDSPEPPPFDNTETPEPAPGIYLHWTLPRALRHGVPQDDGTMVFPFVPNRWVVARIQSGADPKLALKAWLIESDYIDSAQGTTPFVDPAAGKPTLMGRARLLSVVESPTPQASPFLRAIGPGNAAFSIFSPGVQNIFAFVDDMTAADDKTPVAAGGFIYYVAGWYSDPAHDPLADVNLEWVANAAIAGTYTLQARQGTTPQFNPDWYVYSASSALPTKMLVHSQTSGVPWSPGADNVPPPDFPADIKNTVKVAVGNTSIDALCALINSDGSKQTEADLLQAFQYNLLEKYDEPGSAEALKMEIRKHWFSASPGGTLWSVVASPRSGDTSQPAPATPVLTQDQQVKLAALNAAQAELDRQSRILESMQWNMLSLWWKFNYNNTNSPPVSNDTAAQLALHAAYTTPCTAAPAQPQPYYCQVTAQLALVDSAQKAVADASSALTAALDATQTLKAIEKPAYNGANDPVILISGLNRSTQLELSDSVLCRLPSQTVGSLTVNNIHYSADASGGTNVSGDVPVLADPKNLLPDALQVLNRESHLLSPWNFAVKYLNDKAPCPITPQTPGQDPLVDAVNKAIGGLVASPGAQFAPLSYAAQAWIQPWVPVLMDWQVTVLECPAYQSNSDGTACDFNASNWTFNGTDFVWNGVTVASGSNFDDSQKQMQLSGRTFITPHLSANLAEQLEDYVSKHQQRDPAVAALLTDLESRLTAVHDLDLLSQRLSGMLAGMVQRSYRQNPSPQDPALLTLLGNLHRGFPNPYPDDHSTGPGALAVWNYAPFSGTFFVIDKLTIIDSFGRSIDLMQANGSAYPGTNTEQPEDYFYPYTAPPMLSSTELLPGSGKSKDATQRMMQLPPRMIQDSQLKLALLPNDGVTYNDISLTAGSNPVCGWLVPNHLDRSLAVYAPDGKAWGELYLSQNTDGTYQPVWQPDPTSTKPMAINDLPSVYVRNILNALCNHASDNGFYDMLKVIDETLWTINPRGQRDDQDLSVLIGRPLAVVRMDVSLKLRGLPHYRQDWDITFDLSNAQNGVPAPLAALDGGVLNQTWPVLLGSGAMRDDGLVGYFADDPNTPADTWNTFNAVNLPADVSSPFLKQIGAKNCLQLKFTDDTVTRPDPKNAQCCGLTLLLDPRGSVHAFSGLLPVATAQVPEQFVTPALSQMSYLFRIGPLLTPSDMVRMPRPAESKGTWTWFDKVLKVNGPIVCADGKARFGSSAIAAKEGWLKLTPNPPLPPETQK